MNNIERFNHQSNELLLQIKSNIRMNKPKDDENKENFIID